MDRRPTYKTKKHVTEKKVLYFKTNVSQKLILQNNAQYHLYIANTFLPCYFFFFYFCIFFCYSSSFVKQTNKKKSGKDVLEKCTCDPLITVCVIVGLLVRSTVESQASYRNDKFKQTNKQNKVLLSASIYT